LSKIKRTGFSVLDLVFPAKYFSQIINKSVFVPLPAKRPIFFQKGRHSLGRIINVGAMKLPFALAVQITLMFLSRS
jgi:hypothetical protein